MRNKKSLAEASLTALKEFFLITVVVLLVIVVLLVTFVRVDTERNCMKLGWPRGKLTWNLEQYCIRMVGGTEYAAPLDDIAVIENRADRKAPFEDIER